MNCIYVNLIMTARRVLKDMKYYLWLYTQNIILICCVAVIFQMKILALPI